jgi:hypothetical protein
VPLAPPKPLAGTDEVAVGKGLSRASMEADGEGAAVASGAVVGTVISGVPQAAMPRISPKAIMNRLTFQYPERCITLYLEQV